MKIRDLNSGDTFRFAKGKATYVMLSCYYTDEVGWLINFAHTRTGQKYQYQEPLFRNANNPTEREVIRIKKQAVNPKSYNYGPDYRTSQYSPEAIVEKQFGIKLSKRSIIK